MCGFRWLCPRGLVGWLLCATTGLAGAGEVRFVDDDAPADGDGLTWDTAYRHLQDGLAAAVAAEGAVTEIRVGQGTYRPDRSEAAPDGTGDRTASFHLLDSVAVRGGYQGHGAALPDKRNPAVFISTLSGDLVGDDAGEAALGKDDNAYHVVTATDVNLTAVLDGFTVRGGNADGPKPDDRGGGMYVEAASPSIMVCTFVNNAAQTAGGGMSLLLGHGTTVTSCVFDGNVSAGSGGGIGAEASISYSVGDTVFMHNTASAGSGLANLENAFVALTGCDFIENGATTIAGGTPFAGGGAYAGLGSTLNVTDCLFDGNVVFSEGGAIACDFGVVDVEGSTFQNNGADDGGAMSNRGAITLVSDSVFHANGSGCTGGAMRSVELSFVLVDTTIFDGNTSPAGGAVYNHDSVCQVTAATFDGNIAQGGGAGGGAIHLAGLGGQLGVFDSQFLNNQAGALGAQPAGPGDSGGAINVVDQSWTSVHGSLFLHNDANAGGAVHLDPTATAAFTSSSFLGNTAFTGGGAHCTAGCDAEFAQCRFSGNSVAFSGGGLFGVGHVLNCTFSANSTGDFGTAGGIATDDGDQLLLANTILWGNTHDGPTDQDAQITVNAGTARVDYCDIQGLDGSLGGQGNIGLDPLFADPDGRDDVAGTEDDDLRVDGGSPCIDAGHNWALPADLSDLDDDSDTIELLPLDIDGDPRIADDPATSDAGCGAPAVVDMGVHEFRRAAAPSLRPGDSDGDGFVDVDDLVRAILEWGLCDPGCCLSDFDRNGRVDENDLTTIIVNWLRT